ncbi:hypothetical protein PI126_g7520 [Phytophthora idaei]|nr:hypothetical protein PI126_g7520 [Phytophthora idaei]
MKGRFTVNPFNELRLTPSDIADLEALVGSILDANISRYEEFLFKEHCRIDANHWKLVKSRDNTKVYSERNYGSSRVGPQIPGALTNLPSLLCFGTAVGDLEDMMFGVQHNATNMSMQYLVQYKMKSTIVRKRQDESGNNWASDRMDILKILPSDSLRYI